MRLKIELSRTVKYVSLAYYVHSSSLCVLLLSVVVMLCGGNIDTAILGRLPGERAGGRWENGHLQGLCWRTGQECIWPHKTPL